MSSTSFDATRARVPEDTPLFPPRVPPVFASGGPVPGLSSWLLERKLGGGGFGEVWLAKHAWDPELRPRAVKFCTDPAARHRLVTHEKNVVLRVMKYAGKHPNIIPLLDCNLEGDAPWLMYEFVEGGTLAGAVGQWRKLPPHKRIDLAVPALHAIAGALGAVHRFDPPLVHRDMKPHNILMAGSVPRITDFGIGGLALRPAEGTVPESATEGAARLPDELRTAGTRIYAPPEQLFGNAPSPRDDVYALGIIAYQLFTGDLTTAPGPDTDYELRRLRVPGELVTLVMMSAAINPDRRPADAGVWADVLEAFLRKTHRDTDPTTSRVPTVTVPALAEPVSSRSEPLPARTEPAPAETVPHHPSPPRIKAHWGVWDGSQSVRRKNTQTSAAWVLIASLLIVIGLFATFLVLMSRPAG
ncbi:serine/threonine protein kinase [Frigoriglobus tundricola]|uniref:Protein kinase domain-containing protein n=1 Tax=Frigoriglobus tundricola TaxID=2774151 RepID=A0A6M5YKR2_9BACT|nr:serine/threonine-protein kinase [Frigoriglobus tundricola]QJW93592.1 hypothetical protein FTUN_1099 [Frigoriglobus tundricola]